MEGRQDDKEKLVAELKNLKSIAEAKDMIGLSYKIADKGDALRASYTSAVCETYELFHLLSGSTLREPTKNFDFPGEDSIEAFIRSL